MPIFTHSRALIAFILAAICTAANPTTALGGQDSQIRSQYEELDLADARRLTVSPDGELLAGLVRLPSLPRGPRDTRTPKDPGSLLKVWSLHEKQILHEFKVSGTAYAVAFGSDSGTVVVANKSSGNLGWMTTVGAWDLPTGAERELGEFAGEVVDLRFEARGNRLAVAVKLGYFEALGAKGKAGIHSVGQIKIWSIGDSAKPLNIGFAQLWFWDAIMNPDPKIPGKREKAIAAYRRTVPVRLSFSPDGRLVIGETEAGFLTLHDSNTGEVQDFTGTSSVGTALALTMITLLEVPPDVPEFTLNMEPSTAMKLLTRSADGWWHVSSGGKATGDVFKVDGARFLIKEGQSAQGVDIAASLGMTRGTNLRGVHRVRHPLGEMKVVRMKDGLGIQLKPSVAGHEGTAKPRAAVVRWGK